MMEAINQLKNILNEVYDLQMAQNVLGWDQATNMPAGGALDRSYQMGTLAKLSHQQFTSDTVGELLEKSKTEGASIDEESDDACLVKVAAKHYERARRVPHQWIEKFVQVTSNAQTLWEKAKADSDFALFEPHLKEIYDLRKEYSEFFKPYEHIYDPLLDEFEPGLKTQEVQTIFNEIRPHQVALIEAIHSAKQVQDDFLYLQYPKDLQWQFSMKVISKLGFNFERGRMDISVHPFTTGFGWGDSRITTHIHEKYLPSALFSSIHECGHAMYEQNISQTLRRSLLCEGASMAIHESQSRLWENLVGRSYMFWSHFYPELAALFPAQLGNVDLKTFYRGINCVKPGMIRTEADEATYNLHIMLRMEIEIGVLEGKIAVKELPQIWTEKMQSYLGVTPKNDAEGVLQDVHWSGGMMGYFPTYALGNIIGAQIWEKINQEIPELDSQIGQGNFQPLLAWLSEKIYRHGSKFEPKEIIQKVTCSGIKADPYIHYLENKYKDIYNL
jgi:carboxypeptidase Taq